MSWKYADIVDLPHPVSAKRSPMSMQDRAAQFSPFAALTGYEDSIAETARLTDERIELDTGLEGELDQQLRRIHSQIAQQPRVTFHYFRPDGRKSGGAYVTVTERVKKIDPISQEIQLITGQILHFSQIYGIEFSVLQD